MKIINCPIEFHDLQEIAEFLANVSPKYALMFDGCCVDLISCLIMFYYTCDREARYYLHYKTIHREPSPLGDGYTPLSRTP